MVSLIFLSSTTVQDGNILGLYSYWLDAKLLQYHTSDTVLIYSFIFSFDYSFTLHTQTCR